MHITKFNMSQKAQIIKHITRQRGKDSTYGNQDIKEDKTKYNYHLFEPRDINPIIKRAQEQHQETTGRAPKVTAVVLASAIIDVPDDYLKASRSKQKALLERAMKKTIEHFGIKDENLVYAEVHLDETRPHLHFGWVPLHKDGKLNAKEQINRTKLKSWHDEVNNDLYLGFKWYKGGIVAEEPTERMKGKFNMSMSEYKKVAQMKDKLELELDLKTKDLLDLQKELSEIKNDKRVNKFFAYRDIDKENKLIMVEKEKLSKKETLLEEREVEMNTLEHNLKFDKQQFENDKVIYHKTEMKLIGTLETYGRELKHNQNTIFEENKDKPIDPFLIVDVVKQETKEKQFNYFVDVANKWLDKTKYHLLTPIRYITDRITDYREKREKTPRNERTVSNNKDNTWEK